MKKINNGIKNKEFNATKFWFDFHKSTILTINPLLYAIEGNKRKTPNFKDFCELLDEAEKAVTTYSDKFKVVPYPEELRKEVFQNMVQVFHLTIKKEIRFLFEVIPLVYKTQPKAKLHNLEKTIDEKATLYDINGRLSHLAVLDLLYEDTSLGKKSHARGLLKPKEIYTEEDAYNALSDLLNLELLLHVSRVFDKVFFCTADFHLAAFWVGLNIHNVSYSKGKFNIKFTNENLFSRADSSFLTS